MYYIEKKVSEKQQSIEYLLVEFKTNMKKKRLEYSNDFNPYVPAEKIFL